MAKVSVSIPDDVVAAAKAAGFNISKLATEALSHELDRRAKAEQLDAYLARLDAELGPVTDEEADAAAAWADQIADATEPAGPARRP